MVTGDSWNDVAGDSQVQFSFDGRFDVIFNGRCDITGNGCSDVGADVYGLEKIWFAFYHRRKDIFGWKVVR